MGGTSAKLSAGLATLSGHRPNRAPRQTVAASHCSPPTSPMPRIFDNIATDLPPALRKHAQISQRSDFCAGYFNLRGRKAIDGLIEQWPGGEGAQCRLLVGMQRLAQDELRLAYSLLPQEDQISQQAVIRLKRLARRGVSRPAHLRRPHRRRRSRPPPPLRPAQGGQVVVKLYLRHTLHAKLYLCFRPDPNNPITGFVGSSNLTLAGLSNQGELNVDVLDHDATEKLAKWFEDRWGDNWCVDITKEFIQVIDESYRGRDGVVSATPPSEPDGRISRIRLSSQWFLRETNHRHKCRVPD